MSNRKEPVYCKTKVQNLVKEFTARPDWLSDFVAGEGCITVYFNKQRDGSRYPYQIQPALIIVQHERDIEVLHRLKRFFNCGQVSKNKGKNNIESKVWQWHARDIKILCDVIIPFFEKNKIVSTKNNEFILFKGLCFKMKNKYHLQSMEAYYECLNLGKSIIRLRATTKNPMDALFVMHCTILFFIFIYGDIVQIYTIFYD